MCFATSPTLSSGRGAVGASATTARCDGALAWPVPLSPGSATGRPPVALVVATTRGQRRDLLLLTRAQQRRGALGADFFEAPYQAVETSTAGAVARVRQDFHRSDGVDVAGRR